MFINLVKIVFFDFKKYTIFMLVKLLLIYETPSLFILISKLQMLIDMSLSKQSRILS